MLPRLVGGPIRVEIRRSLGSHLAGASIPRRVILLDAAVLARRGEFERILIHEVISFRMGAPFEPDSASPGSRCWRTRLRRTGQGRARLERRVAQRVLTRARYPPPHAPLAPLRLRKLLRLRRVVVCRPARARRIHARRTSRRLRRRWFRERSCGAGRGLSHGRDTLKV